MPDRRILLFLTDLEIGGTPTVVRELATRLRPFAPVEVACLKPPGPVAAQLLAVGVPVTALGATRAWHIPRAVRTLRRLLIDRRIDTLFSFLVHANAVAAMALRRAPDVRGFQSIQTVQPSPRWHWRVQQRVHHAASAIVLPSPAVARVAQARCGVPLDRCVMIPNAIDPDAFPRCAPFRAQPLRVGFLGRFDPVKRIDILLRATQMLCASLEAQCHLFGDGPEREHLERLAATLGITDRVHFHGAVDAPQAALRNMDVLVLPSAAEGFGLVLIEAMAAGVPVVACNAGGAADVVSDGQNGLLFIDTPDRDAAARDVARFIVQLSRDGVLRQRLIDAGLSCVRERYTWEVVLPQYRRLLGV